MNIDLFGRPVLDSELPFRREKAKRKEIPRGYAAIPGTGPKGEFCASCQHAVKVRGGRKRYWKCYLRRRTWSNCYATDIRLKSPACRYWELQKISPFKTATA